LKSASSEFPLTARGAIDFTINPAEGIDPLVDLLKKRQVNLVLVNFRAFGEAQERSGIDSKEAIAALEGIDAEVGRLSGIAIGNDTTFVVVSDSARAPVEREFRPNVVLAKREFLTTDNKGDVVSWKAICHTTGGSAAVFIKNAQDEKLITEVEKAFREIHEKAESPIWRVIVKREAARLGADPRAILFLDASPLYVMSSKATGGTTARANIRATSGYLPQRSEMRATLVMAGRGIKPGVRLEFARLVDIAPTVSRMLGLELRTSRGRVLNEVLIP
ncbi:MAG: alkaline phosphatase family protein, partial [Acidobacteriota bacterium]